MPFGDSNILLAQTFFLGQPLAAPHFKHWFWQLMVNYNTLRTVMTIKGELQHIMISSDN